jgi:hypothetical protein
VPAKAIVEASIVHRVTRSVRRMVNPLVEFF